MVQAWPWHWLQGLTGPHALQAHELPELAAARHADAAEQSDTEACHVVHPNEWSYGEPGLHIHGADEAPDMQPSTSSQAASSAAPGLAAPAPATGSGRRETVVTPSPQQLEQQLPMGAGPAQRARIEAGLQALSHHFDQSLQEASANEPAKPAAAAGEHATCALPGCPGLWC